MSLVKKTSSYLEHLATERPVALAGWVALATAIVVIGVSLPYWTRDFWGFLENVAVEAHGMIFDLLVIGWFILWLNKRAEKQLDIRRYQEEIDDYRRWHELEASHRIAGNIRRLNKLRFHKINLSDCYLENAILEKANLRRAEIERTCLNEADLRFANLNEANLKSAKLIRANLYHASLSGADLENARLYGANLVRSDLSYTILYDADLEGVSLGDADLSGALIKSNFGRADLTETNLSGTILLNSDLSSTTSLTVAQLTSPNPPLLCGTKLPAGMEHLSNRDADKIPQVLLDRYPDHFKTLEDAKKQIEVPPSGN